MPGLAPGGRAADADEQPRRGGGRAPGRACTAAPAGPPARGRHSTRSSARSGRSPTTTRRCSSSPGSPWACSARTSGRRVLIANSNLVGEWSNWDEFRRLEALGLTMYGQMTAGLWIYIGSQGSCRAPTSASRRSRGGASADRSRARSRSRPDSRHGRRAAARGDDERGRGALRGGRPRSDPPPARDPLPRRGGGRPRRRRGALPARQAGAASASVGLCANAAEVVPELLRQGLRGGRGHRPDERARSAGRLRAGWPRARRGRGAAARRSGGVRPPRAALRGGALLRDGGLHGRGRRGLRLRQQPARRGEARRLRARVRLPGVRAGVHVRPLFCAGKGPFRWVALSGDPEDIAATDRAVLDEFPDDESLARWIRLAGERIAFQGLPARICWLGYGERRGSGCASTRWCEAASCGRRS